MNLETRRFKAFLGGLMTKEKEFKKEYVQQLDNHLSKGLSFLSFGGVIQCSHRLLYSYLKKNPEFKAVHQKHKRKQCVSIYKV